MSAPANRPGLVYTSTVTARGHVGAGVALAALALAVSVPAGMWLLGTVVAVCFVLTGVHLGVVRLTVRADGVRAGQGPWPGGRRIPAAALTDVQVTHLGRWQVLGIGLAWHRLSTRLTVRAGPTLLLVLGTGEHLWISTADPVAAARLLTPSAANPDWS